jgi:predicted branched-subunit amino acid permease
MDRESLVAGIRAGLPLAAAVALVAVSFGVLAEPVIGPVATIVMSVLVFAGSAQFGSVAVLGAGGGVPTALTAAVLLNARYIPMGVALAPSLRGGWLRRAAYGETMIDASWAMANRGGGRFDPDFMVGATLPSYPAWIAGTVLGVFAGDLIGDPADLGLDVLFPAFFLFLLMRGELRRGRAAIVVAVLGAAIALALIPVAPAGVPVIAAVTAALLGLSPRFRVDEDVDGPERHPEIEGDPVG